MRGGIKLDYQYLMTLGNKRYYRFDKEIKFDVWGRKLYKPTKYVVVSDASTHVERLVFPIYIINGFTEFDLLNHVKECIEIDFLQIAGEMTMLIHGGDAESVKDDKEYLEELIKANGEVV